MRRTLLALAMMVVTVGCQTGPAAGGIGAMANMGFLNISQGVNGALGQLGVAILDAIYNRVVAFSPI